MAFMEYRNVLEEIIRVAQPHTYVEIGILRAGTFNLISPHVTRAVAVDKNGCKYVTKLPHVEIYPILSDEFFLQWSDPIDICFIDADHSKQAVLRDFDNALKFIREGTGAIFLHDTHPANRYYTHPDKCNDAYAAAWEIRTAEKYRDIEIVTLPWGGAGLSICRKAPRQLAWKD